MTKRNRRLDDDDDHRLLRDGEFLRVPMMMRDAAHRDELDSYRFGLNDGAAMHRPGYRHDFVDTNRDTKEQAYRDAERDLTSAWRSNDAEPSDEQKGNDREIPLGQITGDTRKDAYLSYQEDLSDSWRGAQ